MHEKSSIPPTSHQCIQLSKRQFIWGGKITIMIESNIQVRGRSSVTADSGTQRSNDADSNKN